MNVLALLLLTGCRGKETITWLEGAGYGWVLFNHRLSYYETRLDSEGAQVAVIGGTSTTAVARPLPKGCDQGVCNEFPVFDDADVRVSWGRSDTRRATAAVGSAELIVDAAGAEGTLEVELPHSAGDATAIIQGFVVDTDQPLTGGDACYLPGNGWMPTHLGIALSEVSLDGTSARVDVAASFEAGETLEKVRECIDDVNEQAAVRMVVDVLVVGTDREITADTITISESYDYGSKSDPVEQPIPEGQQLSFDPTEQLVGWSALDWRFHVDDPEARGAYLRTLDFVIDGNEAAGTATNYSPGTQLSGFDYAFEGTVQGVDLGQEVDRGHLVDVLPAEVDDDYEAIVHQLKLPDR